MKKWFKSKTVWLNAGTLTLSVLTFLVSEPWFAEHQKLVATTGTVIGVLGILLRFMTAQPLGK